MHSKTRYDEAARALMHKIISIFLFIITAIYSDASFARTVSAERVVEYVARQAQLSATLTDFVKKAAISPVVRDEMMSYLNDNSVAGSRIPTIYASGASFLLDLGDREPIPFKLVLAPRPQYVVFNRVVYLDRPTAEISRDLAAVFESQSSKTSAFDFLLPKANAFVPFDLSESRAAMSLVAKASVNQVESAASAEPGVSSMSPIGDDAQEIRKNMAELGYTFECKDLSSGNVELATKKKSDVPNKVIFSWPEKPGGSPRTFSLENFDKDANSFTFKLKAPNTSEKDWDPTPCVYTINGDSAKASAACGPKKSVFARKVLPQKIALKRVMSCCASKPPCDVQAVAASAATKDTGKAGQSSSPSRTVK